MSQLYTITNASQSTLVRSLDPGREFVVAVAGTFSNATASVQYLNNGTWTTFSGDTGVTGNGTFSSAREAKFINCGSNSSIKIAGASVEAGTYIDINVCQLSKQ